MLHPTHVDGRTVVILRQGRLGFHVVESGLLSYDGESLWLGEGECSRVLTDEECAAITLVGTKNRIWECQGFDFFVLTEADG
jgi:hypothetical protein